MIEHTFDFIIWNWHIIFLRNHCLWGFCYFNWGVNLIVLCNLSHVWIILIRARFIDWYSRSFLGLILHTLWPPELFTTILMISPIWIHRIICLLVKVILWHWLYQLLYIFLAMDISHIENFLLLVEIYSILGIAIHVNKLRWFG